MARLARRPLALDRPGDDGRIVVLRLPPGLGMTTDVTVIVAAHDRPTMLEVGLHSVLASAAMVPETVRIVVIDDASADVFAVETVARRCGVEYWRNDRNMGVGATLARGFDGTDSEFTMFWGDDDYMLPRFLPLHLAKIREGYDAVSGSYWRTDSDLRPVRELTLPLVTFRDLMGGRCNAVDQSLIRRSALDGIPWRPERERAMLMTMWLALTHAGKRMATIDEPTWLYRRHDGNLSRRRPSGHDMALRQAAIDEYRAVAV